MAKMRARRAPFSDARDGRLKRKVRRAFLWSGGKPVTTTELVKQCYWSVNFQEEEIKSWHRTNVSRVADLFAIRIGRATSQGRPIMWSPRPELMQGLAPSSHVLPSDSDNSDVSVDIDKESSP
jgi:hypothetical protein